MRAYVTTVGTSPQAVLNPLWYLMEVKGWIPDEVYLFWNDGVTRHLETAVKLIKRLSRAYGVDIKLYAGEGEKFREEDPVEFREKVSALLKNLKENEYEVVVDITPGRKFMSALLLGAAYGVGVSEVTYLHLSEWTRYIGGLLFEIPIVKQELFTMRELTGRRGSIRWPGRRRGEAKNVKTDRKGLMAVLDSFYLDGERKFTVKVSGKIIGDVSLGEDVAYRVPRNIDLNDGLHGDVGILKQALIAGGMVPVVNWSELIGLVKTLKSGGRPVYIGFDTNALLMRMASRVLDEPALRERNNLIVDFVYSDEVQVEVSRIANGYKLPYDRELGNFSNQPGPRARLGALGVVELENLRDAGAERANSKETFEGDTKIALDYKAFAEEKQANVIVITLDDRAYAQMSALKGSGLVPFKLDVPFSLGETYGGSWGVMRDTLYTLAVTLGEIQAGRSRILGVWPGKGEPDWRAERVEVSGFRHSRILEALK
ncbi:hypothetical protein [Thermococcus sp. Bubb.Bath]|uniref:hypothetical protein n=1 Tax=Thermococcus sp. Bubb.Bath TaxID=1638242 RepID=UPI0014394B79|nr:hypothetical protein [Thermococcus sp. Bubb.Bath]NJF24399.1 hypothetical protein [Thermococcus sp. Bubb.Bath]